MTYLLYLQLQAVNLHSSSLPRTQLFGLSSCHKGHTHQLLLSPSGQRARKGRLLKLDDVCMASLLLYMLSILPNRKFIGLPRWLSGKESTCQCRRHGFNPWVGKIPWRMKWQSTPVLLPGKSHGQMCLISYSPWGLRESDTTEQIHFQFLSLSAFFTLQLSHPYTTTGKTIALSR